MSVSEKIKAAEETAAAPQVQIPANAQLYHPGVSLGCDPEFFFEKDGKIIGAEKVFTDTIPKGMAKSGGTKIVLDGVQAEINPSPGHCREGLSSQIAAAFQNLRTHLGNNPELAGVKVSFKTNILLSQEELGSLSEKAQKLGCLPSLNRALPKGAIDLGGAVTRRRSAGGHLHLGMAGNPQLMKPGMRETLVDVLDIMLGNTCVLLDRDPKAALRRKYYGRAGEYRLPKHGLEYRTLSNFWLRHYVLMSFVTGVARNAVGVVATDAFREQNSRYMDSYSSTSDPYSKARYSSYDWSAVGELMRVIGGPKGLVKVRKAINTNNWDLAKENFDKIKPFIERFIASNQTGLTKGMLDNFELFITGIKQDGLEAFFPQDPFEYWCNHHYGSGWERFIMSPGKFAKYKGGVAEKVRTTAHKAAAVKQASV